MSDTAAPSPRTAPPWLFAVTVFLSAGLVFLVEPMMARLVLPILGGSAAVWNTSLAFFQAALLGGYVYAHGLQRLRSLRRQILVHAAVLALAALSLPLGVSAALGDPAPNAPALWLLAALAVSVGAPFMALSATAPLVQAWHARAFPHEPDGGPWGLYAASNLGSLLALVAYPVVVEPLIPLHRQTLAWSGGYLAFALVIGALGLTLWRGHAEAPPERSDDAVTVTWLDRVRWILLAAIPSSLMLGVTSYVTTDVGSAPFLWVAPLALYLLTFVVAFQPRPVVPPRLALLLQAALVLAACALSRPMPRAFLQGLGVHFTSFFFTALICHQALVARRPAKGHLTDFYICMSLGGVVGGAVNAFLAPVVLTTVAEYPAALVLACLARPWDRGSLAAPWRWAVLALCGGLAGAAVLIAHPQGQGLIRLVVGLGPAGAGRAVTALLLLAGLAAFLLRREGRLFTLAALILTLGGARATDRVDVVRSWRGFFGVLRESRLDDPRLGGEIRMLAHGTTLHGAQARAAAYRCRPLLYYAHETPIGQVFQGEARMKPALSVGAVGLGTGSVAAYDRAADNFTFFEIDPLVARIARDSGDFTYLTGCARGSVAYRFGDARLTLARQPDGRFDILLIDAFSSDSVPAHLLTVEAARMYLRKIKPDGVVVLHLSNRNLDLVGPAQAVARAAGGQALFQAHFADPRLPSMWESSEDAVIIARGPAGLAPFAGDSRWRPADAHGVRPWTDDYTDLFGALVRRLRARWAGEP